MKKRLLLFVLVCILAWACSPSSSDKAAPSISFYHWKSRLNLESTTQRYLDSLDVKRLYVRFFDVKWDASRSDNTPVAMIQWDNQQINRPMEIVPTIYITNRSLENILNGAPVDSLAHRIGRKIQGIIQTQFDTARFSIPEVQMDCDWTLSTRHKYFRLLEVLRKHYFARLSATIRLHQIKYYQKTGVPPVDKGVLMYYNMGKIDDPTVVNSILNNTTARQYHQNFDLYPLDLDLALPIFHWGVQFRNNNLVQVLHQTQSKELQKINACKMLDSNHFKLLESTYIQNEYVYAGDVIRTEASHYHDLQTALQDLRPLLRQPPLQIIFYHLDSTNQQHFPAHRLQTLVQQ